MPISDTSCQLVNRHSKCLTQEEVDDEAQEGYQYKPYRGNPEKDDKRHRRVQSHRP